MLPQALPSASALATPSPAASTPLPVRVSVLDRSMNKTKGAEVCCCCCCHTAGQRLQLACKGQPQCVQPPLQRARPVLSRPRPRDRGVGAKVRWRRDLIPCLSPTFLLSSPGRLF